MGILLSVIVPAYNCIQYIEDGLKSITDQLREDMELIVVDDGSSDGTAEKLAEYRGIRDNIRICLCEHKGAAGARNTGIEKAGGEYLAFMDCDDCLCQGFFRDFRGLLQEQADLYIFGIRREFLNGTSQHWSVADRIYSTVSDFADEYIRTRHLLIYSNCNKLYRSSLIKTNRIRFDEALSFGEDRLFNYHYLGSCGKIVTSSLTMLRYIQHEGPSMSSCHIPDFFPKIMRLHEEKVRCFHALSKGTSESEKRQFAAYDLAGEIGSAIDRFELFPQEEAENMPLINQTVFQSPRDTDTDCEILVVLGSSNCGYRVKKAFETGSGHPEMKYLVSGHNPHISGSGTESEFMAAWLSDHGIKEEDIYIENRAAFSEENLIYSEEIIKNTGLKSIGIVTAGFQLPRIKNLVESRRLFEEYTISYIPAYGPNTAPDNWYKNAFGREIVLQELQKRSVSEIL